MQKIRSNFLFCRKWVYLANWCDIWIKRMVNKEKDSKVCHIRFLWTLLYPLDVFKLYSFWKPKKKLMPSDVCFRSCRIFSLSNKHCLHNVFKVRHVFYIKEHLLDLICILLKDPQLHEIIFDFYNAYCVFILSLISCPHLDRVGGTMFQSCLCVCYQAFNYI